MKLKDIINIMSIVHGKKTPCDIPEILDEEYYSKSKNTNIKYGDMDLIHFLRVTNKSSTELYDELLIAKSRILRLEKKLEKINNIL